MRNVTILFAVLILLCAGCFSASSYAGAADAPRKQVSIDSLVQSSLAARGMTRSAPCSDAMFVRRVTLDMTGSVPRHWEARQFIESKQAGKRAALVNRLFKRDAYAEYWAMKWCDILRVKAEFPSKLWPNAVQAYHRWITDALRSNMPYDQFARELLTTSGSNFRDAPVNFYRATPGRTPEDIASAVALTFMGQRTSNWPEDRHAGMASFFARVGYKPTSEWKEEVVYYDRPRVLTEGVAQGAVFPDGTAVTLSVGEDPRSVFAGWLTDPGNRDFARCIVNRQWAWLLGRGLVDAPDDFRADNPASHPALLNWLAKELVSHDYDLRHTLRLILNSATYQRSCVPNDSNADDRSGFSHFPVRRLEAEVLIDAINLVLGSSEEYTSEIPEPFTFVPTRERSIALGDGSITSPFLDMFGRPPRDSGMNAERSNEVSDTQRLHLLNSSHIQQKLEKGGAMRRLVREAKTTRAIVSRMYLVLLSRFPESHERDFALQYFESGNGKKADAVQDLAWALINSKEFLYQH